MKRLILAVLAATTLFALSGCGSDNYVALYPTKAAITFAAMSSNSSVVPTLTPSYPIAQSSLISSTTGVQNIVINATLPLYVNVSTTTAPRPTSGQFDDLGLSGGMQTYNNPKRISPSALVTAGPFANNSSVSKRTKINGYVSTDPIQGVKRVTIFLVYSSPRTPGATVVKGSSIDFATLNVSYPAGSALSQELIQEMNKSLWNFQYNNQLQYQSNFYFLPPLDFTYLVLTHTVPTVSKVILGY